MESHPKGMVEIDVLKLWDVMIVDIIKKLMVDRILQSSRRDDYYIVSRIPTNKLVGYCQLSVKDGQKGPLC